MDRELAFRMSEVSGVEDREEGRKGEREGNAETQSNICNQFRCMGWPRAGIAPAAGTPRLVMVIVNQFTQRALAVDSGRDARASASAGTQHCNKRLRNSANT